MKPSFRRIALIGKPGSRETEASLREIVNNLSKDGTTTDEAVRGDIDFIREQNKIKTAIPLGQVVDYGILREVLAEMKR